MRLSLRNKKQKNKNVIIIIMIIIRINQCIGLLTVNFILVLLRSLLRLEQNQNRIKDKQVTNVTKKYIHKSTYIIYTVTEDNFNLGEVVDHDKTGVLSAVYRDEEEDEYCTAIALKIKTIFLKFQQSTTSICRCFH